MMLLALALAAAAPQPWVGISGGPILLRESGQPGVGTGSLVRVEVGYPVADRVAAEVWFSGAMASAPPAKPGDHALLGGGGGARLLVTRLDSSGNLALWLHGGAGWGVPVDGDGKHGPMGFGGALLTFRPFIQRFTLGLEANAVAWRSALGVAVLPSLRCSF